MPWARQTGCPSGTSWQGRKARKAKLLDFRGGAGCPSNCNKRTGPPDDRKPAVMPGRTRVAEGHLKFSLRVLSDKFRKRNSKNMHGAFPLVVSEVIGPWFAGGKLGSGPKKDSLVEKQQELLERAAGLQSEASYSKRQVVSDFNLARRYSHDP